MYSIWRTWLNKVKKKHFKTHLINAKKTLIWVDNTNIDWEILRIPLLKYIHFFLNQYDLEYFEELENELERNFIQSSFKIENLNSEIRVSIEEEKFSLNPEKRHIAEAYAILLKPHNILQELVEKIVVHLLKANGYVRYDSVNEADQYLKSYLEQALCVDDETFKLI